jgi:hypothetical protein
MVRSGSGGPSNQVSNNRHHRQWPLTDRRSQVSRALVLAVSVCTWLRDEEAAVPEACQNQPTFAGTDGHSRDIHSRHDLGERRLEDGKRQSDKE